MKFHVSLILIMLSGNLFAASHSWSLILEEDGIKVFKENTSTSGVIPFKAIGVVNTSLAEVEKILRDYEKKPTWSPKLKKIKVHEKLANNEFIFSEYYSTPWPATDREFLLHGKIQKISKDLTIFSANSIDESYLDDDHIQADVKFLNLKLKRISKNKTEIEFSFHGDMKGWMPVWLMNLIQKKWPMRFIQGLRKQV